MLNNFLKLDTRGTSLKKEFFAGLTTFLAMSYILGVNSTMLSQIGMPINSVFLSTALASGLACIVMGIISKFPISIAPGMAINAFFAITVVKSMGCSWRVTLAAVFISSVVFFIVTIIGLREKILKIIPKDLQLGTGGGIGFFLAFIGLKNAGIIVKNSANILTLGNLTSPAPLLALIGIIITIFLYIRKIKAPIFLGLLITSIIGLIFTSIGFGVDSTILMPKIPSEVISLKLDTTAFLAFLTGFHELFTYNPSVILLIIFSFLFYVFFDASGTIISLSNPGKFPKDEKGYIIGINRAFIGDSLGCIIGSICGTTPLTTYVESVVGISVGGKTGLTAIFSGIFFLLSISFAPILISLFTPTVTVSALVIGGIIMIQQLQYIEWENFVSLASVFMTLIMMILSSSITIGIAFGFITYTIATIAEGNAKKLHWFMWILNILFIYYIFFGIK